MHDSNASAFEGEGKPNLLKTVDSRQTIGAPFAFASATSVESLIGLLLRIIQSSFSLGYETMHVNQLQGWVTL
jgi:hypothetical protein